jgi:amidase
LLISLAAELEAVSGWVTKQPEPWWTDVDKGVEGGPRA